MEAVIIRTVWVPMVVGVGQGIYHRVKSYAHFDPEYKKNHPWRAYLFYYAVPQTYIGEEGIEHRGKAIVYPVIGMLITTTIIFFIYVLMWHFGVH